MRYLIGLTLLLAGACTSSVPQPPGEPPPTCAELQAFLITRVDCDFTALGCVDPVTNLPTAPRITSCTDESEELRALIAADLVDECGRVLSWAVCEAR